MGRQERVMIFFSSLDISPSKFFLSLHSQTTRQLQPMLLSFLVFFRSLRWFPLSFSLQYFFLVFGTLEYLQLCPCQKHPWTKTIVLYLGNTISGQPGRFLTFFRNLSPLEKRNFRTDTSILESRLFIFDMISLRFLADTVSINLMVLLSQIQGNSEIG